MSNHVHLIATPKAPDSMAKTLQPLHMRHTQHINKTRGLKGLAWQGRPFSCALGERHFWIAVRYVERNPVRANMVARAEDYLWSSAAAHCGLRRDPLLSGELETSGFCKDWSLWLAEGDVDADLQILRKSTRSGHPFGDESFVGRMEAFCGRILHPRKPGPHGDPGP